MTFNFAIVFTINWALGNNIIHKLCLSMFIFNPAFFRQEIFVSITARITMITDHSLTITFAQPREPGTALTQGVRPEQPLARRSQRLEAGLAPQRISPEAAPRPAHNLITFVSPLAGPRLVGELLSALLEVIGVLMENDN